MATLNRVSARPVDRLDTLQSIELAEGVEIHLRMAGPYVRVLAYLLDFLIRVGLAIVSYLLVLLVSLVMGLNVGGGIAMLIMFVMSFFYYVIFEAGKRGASPGKRIMGLRVVDTSGAPITFGQSFIRNILRFADMMPAVSLGVMVLPSYGLGLLCTLLNKRFQRLGDLLANTVVIYERLPQTHLSALPPALENRPPGVPLKREEQAALLAFRERGGMWSEARRIELADHASELTGASGQSGMTRLLGMADWLGDKR